MLNRSGHDVTVLTHARADVHEKIRDDLQIVWFPWRRVQGRLAEVNFFKRGNALSLLSLVYNGVRYSKKVIDEKGIDLVICLWIIPSGLYIYINALLSTTRVPYILWALGSDVNKYRNNMFIRPLLKKIIRNSAHVFADGLELCSAITTLSGKECEFLPTFRKITVKSAAHRDGDSVSFLYVGRHAEVKGIDILIAAIIRIEKLNHLLGYHVTIVGEGELTKRMKEIVAENNLNHRVSFKGKISDDALLELYQKADCVIIPSRSESIPLVFSEALQCNKPMIVTDVGDMGLLGRRYGVARVAERENPGALADAMLDFAANPFHTDPGKREELLSFLMMENYSGKLLTLISGLGSR